jgi:hypothetical protein
MNKFWYYVGFVWLPPLFLIHLTKNTWSSAKIVWYNTLSQTRSDIYSAQRYYKIK